MGFILVGIGAAGYLAERGAMGYAGGLLPHRQPRALQGVLFLGVGAVIFANGRAQHVQLGGLWRRMPFTFAFTLIAVGGITGVPLFNGFVSKCLLHHALVYAEGHRHLVALQWAEWVFTITTIGTAAALVKLLAMTFLGSARADLGRPVHEASWRMRLAMGAMAAAIVALGLRPQLLAPVLAAGVEVYAASSAGVLRYVTSPIGHAGDLRAAATALTLGALVAWASARWRVFDRPPPVWLSLDRLLAMAIAAGAVAIRWALAERAAFEASARRLFERERDAVLAASARPPIIGRQLWLRLRVRTLAAVERLAANWELAERFTRELGQRLDESRRLDETRRLQREARLARAETVVVPGSEELRRAARRRIQRDTRDLSLNVGVLFVVWLLFLGALWVVAA